MADEEARTVWCGNLSEHVTEEILYELFLQAGPLRSVRIPKGKDGKRRTFGFVTYKHECSVPYALALFEGTELYKRELKLQSRNTERIKLDPLKLPVGSESFHNRSKSLPAQFGIHNGLSNPVNFNTLLFLGQNLMQSGVPLGNQPNMYSSQLGVSPFLGGINNLTVRSLQGGWSNRNHPYHQHSSGGYKRSHYRR